MSLVANVCYSGQTSQAPPVSKLHLMRTSRLQRPSAISLKNPPSEPSKGPMKAFAPVYTQPREGM